MKVNYLRSNAKTVLKGSAFLFLLTMAGTVSAQWASPSPNPNNNIYYNGGNVGIGTTTLAAVLHVKGGGSGILVERNAADGGGTLIQFKNSLGDTGFIGRMNNARDQWQCPRYEAAASGGDGLDQPQRAV